MKTYEEIYQDFHKRLKSAWSAKDIRNMAAQVYAKQCAEQALKDAARTEKQVSGVTILFSSLEQEAIELTQIFTP